MTVYGYFCSNCGEIEGPVAADKIICLKCNQPAKRSYRVAVQRSSLKHKGRWDPQVGRYVSNDAEFRSALAEGAARESERLNMEVRHELVDSRDNEALNELHGMTQADRDQDLEPTRAKAWEKADA